MRKVTPDFHNTELSYRERLGYPAYTKGITCEGEHLAQQQFKEECDVNNIVERYGERELFNYAQVVQQSFADVSDVPTYQEALNMVIEAQNGFMELPAKVRSRFNNDPGQLIAFLEDEKNYDEAVHLGLVERKVTSPQPPSQAQQQPEDGKVQ